MNSSHRLALPLLVATLGAASGAVASGASALVPQDAAGRPFTAEDMLAVVQISGPIATSPDGTRLAFVLPDLADDWNVGERQQLGTVHTVAVDRAGPRAPQIVGRPGQTSSFPVFSPDGTRLALYLEGPAGGQPAIWDIASREMRVVGSHYPGRASVAPQWAGDSRIVYQRPAATEPPPETPRIAVLESSDETLPGDAFFGGRRLAGVAVVDLATGQERTLLADGEPLQRYAASAEGDHVILDVAGRVGSALITLTDAPGVLPSVAIGARLEWLADGRASWRSGGRFRSAQPDRVGADARAISPPMETGPSGVSWAPDGERYATLAADPAITDPEIEAPQPDMYTIARPFADLYLGSSAGSDRVNLTERITDQIGARAWSVDGRSLFFVAIDNETYDETLYRYDSRDETITSLVSGRESFGSVTPVPGGVIASIQSATTPPDLWRIDAATGDRSRVTDLNPQLADFAFSEPEIFHFDSQDGDRLGALLFKPAGVESGVPVVTYVYEKLTPGIHRFQARQQIFATHGYAVLMPNVKVKVGETATSFVRSVVPALADVHAMGFTNGKACIWGGSFGAFAVSYVITQTNVFDCAVSRATPPELFRNWASGRDRDSNNIERGQARMGGSPFEVMDRYLSQSAFFHLDKVETPVLITHGQKDFTILHEEGAMMFYALRRLGKEATFVSYREGDHSLYRHSRADALDVHERMLDWFGRYLRE